MPDSQNNGNKIGPPKEMSMEMRLLLALLITVPIMFLAPYLLGPQQPQKSANKTAPTSQKGPSNPAAQTSATAPAPAPATPPPSGSGTSQAALPAVPIDTDLYHIVFTN